MFKRHFNFSDCLSSWKPPWVHSILCTACSLVQKAIRCLECREAWKNLVLLVSGAARRKTARSNRAVSGSLLGGSHSCPGHVWSIGRCWLTCRMEARTAALMCTGGGTVVQRSSYWWALGTCVRTDLFKITLGGVTVFLEWRTLLFIVLD